MAVRSSPAAPAPPSRLAIHPRLLSDERLARSVEDGSERAFAAIYERYHQRLYRYCRSHLRDGDDAYDALQSTLANALAALQRGQRDAPLRPWLFRIAHNETISLIRRREPDRWSFDAAESCVPSAEARADERARLALLVSDLGELPERQRDVLLMSELSGLSHKDIATALGLSVHTVAHAILAARRSLGEFEEGRAMVCERVQRSISRSDGRLPPRARAHVRDCAACAAFAAAIPTRRAGLQALAPPLAPIHAAALLAVLHGATSTQGASGGGVMAAGLSGKTAATALMAKTLAGVAIVAVAGASVAGAVPQLTGSGRPSVSAASPARTSAPERHLRRPAGTAAQRARPGAAPAPARSDARPSAAGAALAASSTSSSSSVSSPGPAGTAGRAKVAGAAASSQSHPPGAGVPIHAGRPHGGGVPVHAGHTHGAGAGAGVLHGKAPAGTSHRRDSGAAGGARSAHDSGAATDRGRELPGATSGNTHTDGGHGRPGEPAGANEDHGASAESSKAPPQLEPPSSAGERQPPPAHEEKGGPGPDGQQGGPAATSLQTGGG
jgi:RNA polymerase sigma factor (sigma-70 family)